MIINGKGFCIWIGVEILFNVEKLLSYDVYRKWNEFGDFDYFEKFCYYFGEFLNGEISVS